MPRTTARPDAKAKLLDAALSVIRIKGYSATTVDELCAAAGVTKGAFFHHFRSKDELGVAAADYWSETTGAAAFAADSIDHLRRYIELLFAAGTAQTERPNGGNPK